MILMTLGYLLGTHLSAINSLKVALVTKAERTEVDLLDRKLTRIEVKLEEALITKHELQLLREHIDRKLSLLSAELQPENQRGEHAGDK